MSGNLREAVIQGLAAFPSRPFEGEYRARAAVLMGIAEREAGPSFLLTRRTNTVSTHKGQVSFPGGQCEQAGSNLEQTALRETFEELGIRSQSIEIAGRLNDYLAATHSRVTPFAGFINGSAIQFICCTGNNDTAGNELLSLGGRFFSTATGAWRKDGIMLPDTVEAGDVITIMVRTPRGAIAYSPLLILEP